MNVSVPWRMYSNSRRSTLPGRSGKPGGSIGLRAPDGGAGLLGVREADVARLVADGLSNKQIGARLFISERTVESHVRGVMHKLGFNSRGQIAGWMGASHRKWP